MRWTLGNAWVYIGCSAGLTLEYTYIYIYVYLFDFSYTRFVHGLANPMNAMKLPAYLPERFLSDFGQLPAWRLMTDALP